MLFDTAYVFVTEAKGRDKQSFAVAREFAENVISLNLGFAPDRVLKEAARSDKKVLLVSCGGGTQTDEAITLKRGLGEKAFAIQLMDPSEGHLFFDLIVSPIFEDKTPYGFIKNVLHVLCMPSRNKQDVTGENFVFWKNFATKRKDTLTMVLVGGSSQFISVPEDDFRQTCETICTRIKNSGENRTLIFITSPRTESSFIPIIKEVTNRLGVRTLISDWNKNQGKDDIVHGLLRHVKDVIVTGDSMSMVSEAVYYGNAVTIANNGAFGKERYARLHRVFFEKGLAQPLTEKWELKQMTANVPNPLAEIRASIEQALAKVIPKQ